MRVTIGKIIVSAVLLTSPGTSARAENDGSSAGLPPISPSPAIESRPDGSNWSLRSALPSYRSADGAFSLSIQALLQFDAASYLQSEGAESAPPAPGTELSSGTNFRRAQLGIAGTLFGNWSYMFKGEFGGTGGSDKHARVQSAYFEYDGLPHIALRIGAYAPPAGLEDATSSSDMLFLERAASSDIVRSSIGGSAREAASVLYDDEKYFAALSYTGGKINANSNRNQSRALLGRLADSVYSDGDSRLVLSGTAGYMFKAETASSLVPSERTISFSSFPEVTVDHDGSKLISTGPIETSTPLFWGVEAGGTWQSIFGQAGYFAYVVPDRRTTDGELVRQTLNLDGWYLEFSWLLTGEHRNYSSKAAAFTAPDPRSPFSIKNGMVGAWEIAARYSVVDLNENVGQPQQPMPLGGIRGGRQSVWTLGINWYPTSEWRFALDLQNVDVSRLDEVTGGNLDRRIQIISMRAQFSL